MKIIIFLFLVLYGTVACAEGKKVPVLNNAQYQKDCGSCHFAYQPALLPERSWKKLLTTLDHHFGENAELLSIEQTLQFLTENAADKKGNATFMLKKLDSSETPIRITELPYFRQKHHEVPEKMVAHNPKVKSFSHCNACHTTAEKGLFNEHSVNIPNFGKWED
jgi:hypothetical protein